MSGEAILEKIENKLYDLIIGMNAEPYNYVWSSVNERDQAKVSYPMAVVYFDSENCVDDQDGSWTQTYYQEANFRIEVRVSNEEQYDNPVVEIRKKLYRCLDDLRMLFGTHWNLQYVADSIMYKSAEIVEERAGDILVPSRMVTRWLIRYECSRTDPTKTVQ